MLAQLNSANEALLTKESVITDLESQVSETKSSLQSALADIQERQTKLEELEKAKAAAEQQLEEVQTNLQTPQNEQDADDSAAFLQSVKAEVCQFFCTNLSIDKMTAEPSYMKRRNSFNLSKDLSRFSNHG